MDANCQVSALDTPPKQELDQLDVPLPNPPSDVLDLSSLAAALDGPAADTETEPELEIRTVVSDDTPYTSATTFKDLNLTPALLKGLYAEMKFEKPSRVQGVTLPLILTPPYRSLIAQAQNGSGKTTCFALGMLSRVDPLLHAPRALCVCLTRELALQNYQVLTKMGKHTGITCTCTASAAGEAGLGGLTDQVVIGTPGTLKTWLKKSLSAKTVRVLVFDEADHMLDQDGFKVESQRILRIITNQVTQTNASLQVLLFSATFSERVRQFAQQVTDRANYVFVEREQLSLDAIRQHRVMCPDVRAKIEVLKERIFPAAEKLGQTIIFVRTRNNASELHRILNADGYKCSSIQGGLTHQERDRVIREFRGGESRILIATDVVARGFDQAQVTLVVNFDLPVRIGAPDEPDHELYLHRIGRSGRFGRRGAAFNMLATEQDGRHLDMIANYFNRHIPEVAWQDEEAFQSVLKDAGLA